MKKSRWADWFLTAGFLGFLALALAVTLIRPKSGWSYYENRNLAHPAELSVETLLDGTFPASVEPVLQDHAAGRNTLMKLSVWVDLHLFHRPVVNQVVPADGMLLGWNPYETPDPAGITAQAEHMAEELARLRDVVEEYGEPYVDGNTGEQVAVKNVLVLYTDVSQLSGDSAGRLKVRTTGSGGGVRRALLLCSGPGTVRLLPGRLSGLSQQPGGVYRSGGPRPHPCHGGTWDGSSGHGAGAGHSW